MRLGGQSGTILATRVHAQASHAYFTAAPRLHAQVAFTNEQSRTQVKIATEPPPAMPILYALSSDSMSYLSKPNLTDVITL